MFSLCQCYKHFFVLNSAEHEICPANKSQITNSCKFFLVKHYKLSRRISLLKSMKISTIVGIFIFISRENFIPSWVEYEKSFIISKPEPKQTQMFTEKAVVVAGLVRSLRIMCGIIKVLLSCISFFRKLWQKSEHFWGKRGCLQNSLRWKDLVV